MAIIDARGAARGVEPLIEMEFVAHFFLHRSKASMRRARAQLYGGRDSVQKQQ